MSLYAGVDPLTGNRTYLTGSTTDQAEAERMLTKFRAQLDEQRSAQTRGVFRMAIDEWLECRIPNNLGQISLAVGG